MPDPSTTDAQHPAQPRDDHQTIIKFVLSGPILGGHEAEVTQLPSSTAQLDDLRERVGALERTLADAEARIDALSRALAATVAGAAAAPGNWSSRRTERAAKAPAPPETAPRPEPTAAEPIAIAPEPERIASAPAPEPIATAPEPIAPEPTAPAPIAPEPIATAPEPISIAPTAPAPIAREPIAPSWSPDPEPYATAVAVQPHPAALAIAAQPALRVAARRPSHPTPPKVRALRRVISVLKNF
jgi:hypothetical protein